jgi:putative sigma-54 modulation protein
VERGFHHVADLSITLPNGIAINAKETTEDMYSSIDLAAARIERQVRKWKEKIRDHKPHGGPAGTVRELVILAEEIEPRPETTPPASAAVPGGYKIIKDERVTARSMTVEDAAMQMNLLGDEHLIFTDAGTGSTSVLYRRRDGNYGLIETAQGESPTGGKAPR